MPTRAQLSKENFMEQEISCSTDACPVLTKVCSQKFRREKFLRYSYAKRAKSYSSVLLDNLTKEMKAQSCIEREIRQEENEQAIKILNFVINRNSPSSSTNDEECVQKLSQTIDIVVDSADIEKKRKGLSISTAK